MNESRFTNKLLHAVRFARRGAVVIKFNDHMTAGIPDFCVAEQGRTTWCEVKLTTNKRLFEPLQLEVLKRLHGYYVIWSPTMRCGWLFQPDEISMRQYMAGMEPMEFEELVGAIARVF